MPQTAEMHLDEGPEDSSDEELEEIEEAKAELDEAESALVASKQATLAQTESADPMRVIEAALFLGNRKFTYPELAILTKESVRRARTLVEKLAKDFNSRESSIELAVDAEGATLQVKPAFLPSVSSLSKNVELSRKALRILALIAKRGKILQSELRKYFRGDVYEYIAELKELGYVVSSKSGNTRLLAATTKFHETFQLGDMPVEAGEVTSAHPEESVPSPPDSPQ